jgi:hypothetical protein
MVSRAHSTIENIMKDHQKYFLGEFQTALVEVTGLKFHSSFIWKRLFANCGYSLQVATE